MLEPELLRTVPSLSTLPMLEPELLRTVPSLSSFPMLEPELLRMVPSRSIFPMLDPELLRMVPSLSNLPTLEPLELRTVPLFSMVPQREPLLLYTAWALAAEAIMMAKARNKIRIAFIFLSFKGFDNVTKTAKIIPNGALLMAKVSMKDDACRCDMFWFYNRLQWEDGLQPWCWRE